MSISGVQGHLLEVTVVGCTKMKETEWIKRQDPYVCLEYGSTKFRTRTCTDGNKNPVFHEKFTFTLIEGLREINVVVWNNNYITYDDFIGSRKVQLADVLSWGYDHRCWPLQSKTGRYAGEVILIMHYNQANKPAPSYTPSAPPYTALLPQPQLQAYSVPPPESTSSSTNFPYSYPAAAYPSAATTYPPSNSSYHGQMHYSSRSCPSLPVEYSSGLYPPRPGPSFYPPMSYPPAGYPAAPYLQPPFASHYGHPGIYGMYTRPPY